MRPGDCYYKSKGLPGKRTRCGRTIKPRPDSHVKAPLRNSGEIAPGSILGIDTSYPKITSISTIKVYSNMMGSSFVDPGSVTQLLLGPWPWAPHQRELNLLCYTPQGSMRRMRTIDSDYLPGAVTRELRDIQPSKGKRMLLIRCWGSLGGGRNGGAG